MVSNKIYTVPQRGSPIGVSALIVGAGIAGLYAALELWRQGIDVQIIERAPARLTTGFEPTLWLGDGFTIAHQVIRSFRNWPYLAEKNKEIAFHPWVAWFNLKGEQLTEPRSIEDNAASQSQRDDKEGDSSQGLYRHSRPKFHLMLEKQLEETGLKVQYGKRVTRYFDGEPEGNKRPGVELDSGEVSEADLVIAADGIGSHSTKATLGYEARARSTGFAIYRATIPVEFVRSDSELMEKFDLLPNGHGLVQLWFGKTTQATWEANESWTKHVSPQQVIDDTTSKIEGWPDYVNRLISLTPDDRLIDFELVWRDPQPVWTSPSGRIVQIGDAAHTFFPASGNGANQGLEDAISLAKCLRIAGKEHVAEATKVHNKLRFERVSCLQKIGICSQASQYGQEGNKSASSVPKYVRALMASWIWKQDPEAYAAEKYHEALSALRDGVPFRNTNIPESHTYQPWTFEDILNEFKAKGDYELGDDGWWN
ncbi:hypothetical protein UA08_06659 [Talaromyces atroroseus]|uniref:FAD-binding domain-containing protein n=1 Tax=Talaromyces atroroseus TaxID=1441469 RepID=A0A225AIA8_TALAT|nr:hypothetical protein UA08_06659 [Talaromyces atroroseus]OKL57964.1 hypothetical protein UA08_06659 [Talaromyces atroroseus]